MSSRAEFERRQVIESNSPLSRHSLDSENMKRVISGETRAFRQFNEERRQSERAERILEHAEKDDQEAIGEVPFHVVYIWEFGEEQARADKVIGEDIFIAS